MREAGIEAILPYQRDQRVDNWDEKTIVRSKKMQSASERRRPSRDRLDSMGMTNVISVSSRAQQPNRLPYSRFRPNIHGKQHQEPARKMTQPIRINILPVTAGRTICLLS
jgi:hypothetical protein